MSIHCKIVHPSLVMWQTSVAFRAREVVVSRDVVDVKEHVCPLESTSQFLPVQNNMTRREQSSSVVE